MSLINESSSFADFFEILMSGNPITATKIKNNLKSYTKYKLDLASIEMDSIRKTQSSEKKGKRLTKEEKEKLNAAKKAKEEALKDKLNSVNDRLKELATTEPLKKFVSANKARANLEAANKLLKIAQGEEADALKIKVDKLEDTITTGESKLKNYTKKQDSESSSKAKKPVIKRKKRRKKRR